jgi:hypothetical protein
MPILNEPYLSARERRRFASILALEDTHPSRIALIAFYEARVKLVGFQLDENGDNVDQSWFSQTLNRETRLSSFLYEHVSHDSPPFASWGIPQAGSESAFLHELPSLRAVLCEGRLAAQRAANDGGLRIIAQIERLLELLERAAKSAP